jgi:hypothetical protein
MKRFFQDDPDDQNFLTPDDNDMEEALEAEFNAYINTEEFVNAMNIDLAEMKLNQKLLITASELARKGDWLWKFRSIETQMNKIEIVYIKLVELLVKHEQGEQKNGDL